MKNDCKQIKIAHRRWQRARARDKEQREKGRERRVGKKEEYWGGGWGPACCKIDGKVPPRMSIAHLPRSLEAQQLLSCSAAAAAAVII